MKHNMRNNDNKSSAREKAVTAAEEKKNWIVGERKSSALVILKLITKIKIK